MVKNISKACRGNTQNVPKIAKSESIIVIHAQIFSRFPRFYSISAISQKRVEIWVWWNNIEMLWAPQNHLSLSCDYIYTR